MFLISADRRPTWITWLNGTDAKLGNHIVMLGLENESIVERRTWTKGNPGWGTTERNGSRALDAAVRVMVGDAALMKGRPGQIPTVEDALAALGLN